MTFIEAWFALSVLSWLIGFCSMEQALAAFLAGLCARVAYVSLVVLIYRLSGRRLPPL